MDNWKTLEFRGDIDVKYVDVISDDMGMTMVVRLTGGPGATIHLALAHHGPTQQSMRRGFNRSLTYRLNVAGALLILCGITSHSQIISFVNLLL